ncbi:MAG: CapA family protein [Thermoanaerobaculia bacterium]
MAARRLRSRLFVLCLAGLLLSFGPRTVSPAFAAPDAAFTVALTGDTIVTRPLREKGRGFEPLRQILLGADAALTNLETLFHDYESFNTPPGVMRSDPALAQDLAWAGFDLVARANNHAGDYGEAGIAHTTRALASAGILSAGVGRNLGEARAATVFAGASVAVALVSASATFDPPAAASEGRGPVRARPGIAPLRHTTTYVLSPERMRALRSAAAEMGLPLSPREDALNAFDRSFIVGPAPGVSTVPVPQDLDALTASLRSARARAGCLIFSLHAHEGLDADRFSPAEFVVSAARAAIDAGADAVYGHGPHVLRGIEIWRGRPIFYSLGNFVFEYETIRELPFDEYDRLALPPSARVADFFDRQENFGRYSYPAEPESWESVVAILHGRGNAVESVELRPITLGFRQPRGTRGAPRLAAPAAARKILEDLVRLSRPYGTRIEIRGDVGWILLKKVEG